jgi:ABC-type transport system substrate-binding protein
MAVDYLPSTFIASEVTDVYSQTVLSQIMEGLVSFNPEDLSLQPQLASKWNISPDGSVLTFTLREDVYFHEHELFSSKSDRLMTAEDVKFSIEHACKPTAEGNPTSAYLTLYADQLKGAKEYFEGNSKTISGLKIKGNVVTLELIQPDPTYINKLAQMNASVVSKKIVESQKETDLIGTGPFCFSQITNVDQEKIVLLKNQEYYQSDAKGNALPYLDSVVFVVEPLKLEQLEMFESKKLDLITALPTSRIAEMLEGHINDFNSQPPLMVLYNNPLLTTNYYIFNMTDPRFQDVRVRQAFNYAVNKVELANEVLRNQYYDYGVYGITPPIGSLFKGYDFKGIKEVGYDFDPEKAKKLLADAGYPGGKGFGSVNLRIDIKDLNTAVAEEVAQQIHDNLGINVNIDGSTFEQKDDDASLGRGDMFRTAWVADYSSPETFLANFFGKYVPAERGAESRLNQSRYVNPVFDTYFEKARSTKSGKERFQLYAAAEKELMQNPPMIILWYANDFQLSYSRVRNLKKNAMGLIDLRQVYLKDWTKEEYMKSMN